ncbi:hypothetical protein TWF281_001356 [Arthrobotrys megalospora]
MDKFGLSEGEMMLQACKKALGTPDPTETPIIDRPKDPALIRLYGVNYDIGIVYVKISPTALAWEVFGRNRLWDDRLNQWFTPLDERDPKYGKLVREVLPVTMDVFRKLHARFGVQPYTGPLEFDTEEPYDPRSIEARELDENIQGKLMASRLKRLAIEAAEGNAASNNIKPLGVEEYIHKAIEWKDTDRDKANHPTDSDDDDSDEDFNANYDDGTSSDTDDDYDPDFPGAKLRIPGVYATRIPYGQHNPDPSLEESYIESFKELVKKMTEDVRRELAKIDWKVDNPLRIADRKTAGRWNVAVYDFHAERLRIWNERVKPNIFTSRPVAITLGFGSKFDLYDPRLWVLEDDAPDAAKDKFGFAQIGQNSLQYMLDVVRVQWNNLDRLDEDFALNASFDDDTDTEDEGGSPKTRSGNAIPHTFEGLRPHRRSIISLGINLFLEDLNTDDLEPDLRELAEYAIYRYIDSTPADDVQMRESLLVLWELTKVITFFTGERPGRTEECTC